MGYNIELSFNVLKSGGISELLNKVRSLAEDCLCEDFYEDYEFENKTQFQRRHCIISINFAQEKLNNMIEFLNFCLPIHPTFHDFICLFIHMFVFIKSIQYSFISIFIFM